MKGMTKEQAYGRVMSKTNGVSQQRLMHGGVDHNIVMRRKKKR